MVDGATSDAQVRADSLKVEANTLYKDRKFDQAIEKYDEAISLFPLDLTYYNNKAAVYIELGEFQKAVELLSGALDRRYEISNQNRDGASYEKCAKVYNRMAVCHQKLMDFDSAIEMYNKSLTEDNTRQTRNALTDLKKEKEKFEKEIYINPELAEKHRQQGNNFFKDGKIAEAKAEYDEAIRRNPDDAKLYSNRAAALTKLVAYPDALRDLEKCLSLEPSFVKAYSRKGTVHFFMKELHKALDAYNKGLELDPNNQECINGKQSVLMKINEQSSNMEADEEQVRHAMADPEIQSILSDPQVNLVLKNMQEDPASAGAALQDPKIKNAVEKLVAAGILKIGRK